MELVEYGAPVGVSLTQAELRQLTHASVYWRRILRLRTDPLSVSAKGDGQYLLEARGVAGFIRVGRLSLEIAPKFLNRETSGPAWRAAMWRFLAYGHGVDALSEAAGSFGRDDGIADVLAEMFLTALKGAGARGYALSYRSERMSSSFAKGRLDPKGYKRLLPVSGRVNVIANRLSRDVPINRLLKWAGIELADSVEDSHRRKRLLAWSSELPEVSALPPSKPLPASAHRNYPHLKQAIEIAELLLDDRHASFAPESLSLPGFLWDSDDLFERATRRLFADASLALGLTVSKQRHELARTAGEQRMFTTPDIDVALRRRSVLAADAKYKVLGDHPSNADVYQVMAAGRVQALPKVALLYPSSGTELLTRTYSPSGTGAPETVLVTSIGLDAFGSRKALRKLKSDLRAWLFEHSTGTKLAPPPVH